MQDFAKLIRGAIKRDGRSIYAIARDADIYVSTVQRFASGERRGITIHTVERLCDTLGLVLGPRKRR